VTGGRAEIATKAGGGRAVISVANSGPVVAPDEVDRLFQPFQRLGGERVGSGHGLGLAIVRAIAGAHGATLAAKAGPEGGLEIEVSFPARGDA